uniref:Uncharacterized protein LOC102806873 n=1 Tax=Saccoglossus kowalevskii TaxID=10224 RepID=A0ABM0MQN5_SACKO
MDCPMCTEKQINSTNKPGNVVKEMDIDGKTGQRRHVNKIKVACTSSYTVTDALCNSTQLMKTALKNIQSNPKLKLNKKLAEEMSPVFSALLSSPTTEELSCFIIKKIWPGL